MSGNEAQGWFLRCFGANWQTDVMIVVLVVLLPGLVIFMWRVQRAVNGIDFADWFRGPDGKASWKEAQGILASLIGAWCMVKVTIDGKVPDGFVLLFLVYLAVCGAVPMAAKIIDRISPAGGTPIVPPNQQIKVDAPPEATVTVQSGPPQGGNP